jgi:uncharacterized phage protein gp47/JayE
MALQFPADRNEVATRMKTDVQNNLSGSNPFLRNSYLGALIVSLAGRIYDFYYQLQNNLLPNLFPDTAESSYLQRWGGWVGISKNPATQASGNIVVTGTSGTAIPDGTGLGTSDGNAVQTTEDATLASVSVSITLACSGTTATATASGGHSFATGQSVTISGASVASYDGTYEIVAASSTAFTFTVSTSGLASGSATASAVMAAIPAVTEDYGSAYNLDSGTELAFSSPISGVSSTAYVGYGGLSGGEDVETDTAYRARVRARYQNPVTLFNDAAIEDAAMSVSGVTRVWVQDCTPDVGQVTVYFVCDGQSPITPTDAQRAAVKAAIMAIAPAQVSSNYVIVPTLTLLPVAFTFSTLSPNTSTMRSAIEDNIAQAFTDNAQVGAAFSQYAYQSAIFQTVDLSTGASLASFTLSAPSSDISVSPGDLAVPGTITFPS